MLLSADKIIYDGHAYSKVGIDIGNNGRINAIAPLEQRRPDRMLTGRVLLPGFVNTHSHAFQRLLRGRTQSVSPGGDNFWSWRDTMYWVAQHLDPQDLYIAARQAFLEMILSGVTTVGEFHYLHNQPDGSPYANPHAMADALVYAARDVGLRLSVIHTVYLRGDFGVPANDAQKRFCESGLDAACDRFDAVVERIISYNDARLSWAIAAHSLRAVPIEAIIGLKVRLGHMPYHIHVAEQRREVEACLEHHKMGPVELLARSEILDACTTLIHATHLRPGEAEAIADLGASVCICPSTEADLGDGLSPAGNLYHLGVPLCLGTDGATLSSVMAEAARLEMHERLRVEERNVLGTGEGDAPARRLLHMATTVGATALGVDTGIMRPGKWADFVSYDLTDPALAGADDPSLLSMLMFSSDNRAVRDVIVGGKFVVEEGKHPLTRECTTSYNRLVNKLFKSATRQETVNTRLPIDRGRAFAITPAPLCGV